ncbi:MAG: reverse transcriptase family protein, partial [Bacteroidota bacterium]
YWEYTFLPNAIEKIAGKFAPCSPPVLKNNGQIVTDAKEVSNIFAEHFSNISRKNPESPGADYRRRNEQQLLNFTTFKEEVYNIPFTEAEFDAALSSCTDTAPGPDDIPYAMLRHIPLVTKIFLINLFNRIWKESIFPIAWILAIVLPFCKPLKDSFIPSSYRPIALTSCLCKLMEKMVNNRFVWFLEYKKIYSPIQCGSRKFHSTADVLLQLESSICKAFACKHHHVSVFFDLEKAYDTTWRHGILKTIHSCGIRGEMALFLKAFISSRQFQVRVGSTLSDIMSQEEGVPQGSVLSVTLFALAINGIASVVPSGILSTLFVDDFSISFHAAKMTMAERKLQLCINRIDKWADNNGFKFSSSKSVVVHFCRIRNHHPDPDLYLKGRRLPCVEDARFLGMHLDRRLTWLPHLKTTKVNCLKSMQILKVLSHSTWGSDRSTMLRLYHSLILTKLSYGCEFYSSGSFNHLKTIDVIHHSSIRIATGAFRSSPIPSLLVDAGEIPLDLHRHLS